MKRTFVKDTLANTFKAMDQNGYKKCEIMELHLKTCINRKAEMFVHMEAIVVEPDQDGKTFKLEKDFDL